MLLTSLVDRNGPVDLLAPVASTSKIVDGRGQSTLQLRAEPIKCGQPRALISFKAR